MHPDVSVGTYGYILWDIPMMFLQDSLEFYHYMQNDERLEV